ncbi:MAG: TetR family transcriptional regulator [bacterium]|nr:TetR family transcriptional regulator [bacterium]
MPKIVDHEAERQRLAAAACRTVARAGLEGATLRAIAEEAGCSTGPLVHYFGDKSQIMIHALRHAAHETGLRMLRAHGLAEGRSALRAIAEEGLPLDAKRQDEWRVWLAFWGQAIASPELVEEQHQRYTAWRRLFQAIIERTQAEGDLAEHIDAERACELLVAFIDGIGIQAMFEPRRFPRRRQLELLDIHLDQLFSTV